MSEKVWCRLCLNSCNDYRSLYDDTGYYNVELYEVTVKYFHPTILAAVDGKPHTVMCLGCWRHIWEFHKFQNEVLLAQEQLTAIGVKNEPLDTTDNLIAKDEIQCHDVNVKNETEFLPLSDLELMNSNQDMTATTSANIEPWVPNRETLIGEDVRISEDTKVKEEESDDNDHSSMGEYVDEVGPFTDGQLNNIDESRSVSLSEEESIKLEFSIDDEIPSTSNAMLSSSTEDLADEDSLKKTCLSNDAFIEKWLPTLNCPLCQRSCGNFGSLEKHFKECHPNDRTYVECCQRKFSRRYLLADHVCAHLDPNRLTCKLCNVFFRTRGTLRRHNILQHPKSKEALNYDPRPDRSLDAIVAQWKPHVECAICKDSYPSLTQLQRHFKQKHHNEAFHIFCCETKLSLLTSIRSHALYHTVGKGSSRTVMEHDGLTLTTTSNSEPLLPRPEVIVDKEVRKSKISKINERENSDDIGTITGGDFKNIEQSTSLSVSELDSTKLEFSVDDETPSTSNAMKTSSNANATDEDTLKAATPILDDAFIAKWVPTLNCPLCQKGCTNFASLDIHFKAGHPNEKTYVECCGGRFYVRHLLAEHVCIHIDPDRLVCKLCNIFFKTRSGFREHNIRRHPKSKAALDYYPRSDKNLDAIIAEWKPNIECAICKEVYPSLTLLQRHFQQNHRNEAFHIFCCQRKLALLTSIKSHALRHMARKGLKQNQPSEPKSASSTTTKDLQPSFTGFPCGDTTSSRPTYRTCNICRKCFRNFTKFKEHISIHTGYFQCPYCFQAYKSIDGVQRHMQKNHPDMKLIPAFELVIENDNQS